MNIEKNYIFKNKANESLPQSRTKFQEPEQNTHPYCKKNVFFLPRKHFAISLPRVQKIAVRTADLLACSLVLIKRKGPLACSFFDFWVSKPSSVHPPSLIRWIDNLGKTPPAK